MFAGCIILFSTLRYAPIWTLSWLVVYLLYRFIFVQLILPRILPGQQLYAIHIVRSLILLSGISIFISYIYLYTDYPNNSRSADTLWLLCALVIFIIGQYATTTETLVIVFGFFCILLLTLQYLSYGALDALAWLDRAIKICWLFLLSFVMHVMTRRANVTSADLRLISHIQHNIVEAGSEIQEPELLQIVVRSIAENFRYPHVNIFEKQPNLSLKCVATACGRVTELVETGFELAPGRGIIGHVATTGDPVLGNDVEKNSHYLWNKAFPDTKAELAVGIWTGKQLLGVLDIQDRRKNVFTKQDQEFMKILADYIGKAWMNFRLTKDREEVDSIIQAVAAHFLSDRELSSVQRKITLAGRDLLGADLVVLFERDMSTRQLGAWEYSGDLKQPDFFTASVNNTYHQVHRILSASNNCCYFHEDIASEVSKKPALLALPPDQIAERMTRVSAVLGAGRD